MRMIIKQIIDQDRWSTIFCVGDNACVKGGALSKTVLEKMKLDGIIREVDAVEIIEKYFRHVMLIVDVKSSSFFEIKKFD